MNKEPNAAPTPTVAADAAAPHAAPKSVATVRVTAGGYGMELSTHVAYALPEGKHELYVAAPAQRVATLADLRAEFEILNPMPRDVIRCGTGYAVTSYSAWDGRKFCERWEGFKEAFELLAAHPTAIERIDQAAEKS